MAYPFEAEAALSAELRRQAKELADAASEAVRAEEFKYASELSRKAVELTMSAGAKADEMRYRQLAAQCLYFGSRHTEALAMLTPVLQTQDLPDEVTVYRAMYTYVNSAILLPLRLELIQGSIAQIQDFLVHSGHWDWRSPLLHVEAKLFRRRGMFKKSIELSREALAVWKSDGPGYIADTHLDDIGLCAYYSGDLALVEDTIRTLEMRRENQNPNRRRRSLFELKAVASRLRGDKQEALEQARSAEAMGSYEILPDRLLAYYVMAGRLDRVEELAVKSFRLFRRGDSEFDRCDCHLTRCDYYLALALRSAGAPMVDIELSELPTQFGHIERERLEVALRRAKLAYRSAAVHGDRHDNLLDGTFCQSRLKPRLQLIRHLDSL
jgi:hypothetical protein